MLADHVPKLMEAGVDAFKIEGRMKSVHYVATICGVPPAIDAVAAGSNGIGKRDGRKSWKR